MALVVADRVKETTTTTGTGAVTLAGAVTGFQPFSVVGNGNTTYYCIAGQGTAEWEVGIGTYTASGATLSRDTILASSNGGLAVSFTSGIKDVFVTYPAGKSVNYDAAGDVVLTGDISAVTFNGSGAGLTNVPASSVTGSFTTPQVIDVNSATTALRITQTGAGNALVVEDSTNPDSTPFVVNADGVVLAGLATPRTTFSGGTVTPDVQIEQVTGGRLSITRNSANATAPDLFFGKTRGASVGAVDAVASNDVLGSLTWQGADGTNLIPGARIEAAVDGTPSTNDMPGRLVFSTTADGASTPTERMRIRNDGNISIGSAGSALGKVTVAGTLVTSSSSSQTFRLAPTVPSTTTNGYWTVLSAPVTEAASFTLSNLYHFSVEPQTFGAGSSVTNQFGFIATSVLTGATNNYGFYSDIASGTGRWNFFANGTANNAFAGNTRFGGVTAPTVAVDVTGTVRAQAAATQDAVALAGRAGGTSSYAATITPTTLSANRTVTLPDEDFTVGYLNIPQNSESAAYTLVLSDAGKHIFHPSADTTARTFTIPANSSVAFPIGTAITFVNQNGAGTVTIAITTDTMRLAGAGTTGSRTLAANGVATAIKLTSTEWIISGTGLT